MIGVDTNVLARLLAEDDPKQTEAARRFLAGRTSANPAFIGIVVVVELTWLLRSRYRYSSTAVIGALEGLFMSANVAIEDEDLVKEAVYLAEQTGADIADAIIAAVAERNKCSKTVTFDKNAANRLPGMELLA